LASCALAAYQAVVEDSNARICRVNLKALATALDIYSMDHDLMPITLAQIPQSYFDRAYARIFKEKGAWKIRLAYFITELQERALVYASAYSSMKLLAANQPWILKCPSGSQYSEGSVWSYGFNSAIIHNPAISSEQYRNLLEAGIIVVADCDSNVLGSEAQRHKKTRLFNSTMYSQARGIVGSSQPNARKWFTRQTFSSGTTEYIYE